MTDINLKQIKSGYNLNKINDNFEKIEEVINDELLHNIGGNNVMYQDLDMDSERILNLPAPISNTEPLRKGDIVSDATGATVQYVDDTVAELEDKVDELEGRVSVVYNSVALLKLASLEAGTLVGRYYYEKGDSGYVEGVVKTAEQATADGDVIDAYYNVMLANGNVWVGDRKGVLKPEQWGAIIGDDVANDTHNSDVIDAMLAYRPAQVIPVEGDDDLILPIGGTIEFPAETIVVRRSVKPTRGWKLKGASRTDSVLKRYSTEAELLGGVYCSTVVYIADTWVNIESMTIAGDLGAKDVEGITFQNNAPPSHCNFTSLDIVGCSQAFTSREGAFMCTFRNVNVASCINGFIFDANSGYTSLTFTSCYASSIDRQPWQFVQATYSSLNSCGADVVNTAHKDTELGVYDFFICTMSVNNCGAEHGAYGNGIVRSASSILTIDGLTGFGWGTEYVPDYATKPNYALAPIQCDGAWNSLTITRPRIEVTIPSIPEQTGDIATLLAFNSTDITGTAPKVNILTHDELTSDSIKGQGNIAEYVITSEQVREAIKYASTQKQVTGSGTVLTIPIVPQVSVNRKHMIKVSSIAGNFNGTVALPFQANFAFNSLAVVGDLSSWNEYNAVVTSSGSSIVITLPFTTFDPLVAIELTVSEDPSLIDFDNMTLT